MKLTILNNNSGLYRPLVYFSLYIIVTLLLSFFGPLVYVDYNRFSVLVYMSIFLIVFSLGYKGGIAAHIQPSKTADVKKKYSRIVLILKICVIIAFLTTFFHFLMALFGGKISLSLTSIGQNYFDFYEERRATNATTISEIINFFSGFPRIVTMVLGVYYFKLLRRSYKFLVIAVFVLWLITNTLSYGNQKSLGEVVIYMLIVSTIKMLDVAPDVRKRLIFFSACLLVILSIAISFIQYQRLTVLGFSAVNIDQKLNLMAYYNWDHVIFKILGHEAGLALAAFFMGYLAGGYYGLSLCLQLPFVWTYGFGSSFSLMAFLKIIGGVEYFEYFFNQTYIYRMEATTGWHGLLAWNTIFPWLASDFTFVGALIIFIPVAYVYALCWKEIVKYRNPVSILMFSMLSIGLIFVPANNQLLHGYDGFLATVIMTLFWITMHKKYNIS